MPACCLDENWKLAMFADISLPFSCPRTPSVVAARDLAAHMSLTGAAVAHETEGRRNAVLESYTRKFGRHRRCGGLHT